MKRIVIVLALISLVLAGCGAEASPVDIPIAAPTKIPTPTEAPCSHVDLDGRYVDFRTFRGALYGWIMIAEQTGCEFIATETFFLIAAEPGSEGYAEELSGKLMGIKCRFVIPPAVTV